MMSATFHAIAARSPSWRISPLTVSQMRPRPDGRPRGWSSPATADWSNPCPCPRGCPLLLGPRLEVAARQVESDGVTKTAAFAASTGDSPCPRPGDDQFHLVVQVGGLRRVGDAVLARAGDRGVAGFMKKGGSRPSPDPPPPFRGHDRHSCGRRKNTTDRKQSAACPATGGGETGGENEGHHGNPWRTKNRQCE